MSDTVLVAIITGGVTLTVNLLANWSARKKEAIERAIREQKLDDEIATMNRKLDAHNQYGDKISNIEKAIVRIDTKLEAIKS